jgi:hypothetical protein
MREGMEFDRGLLRHIGLASTAVGAFLCVASPAMADGNMFGSVTNFFSAPFGGNKGDDNGDVIDYRQRPVLVVPPSNDLPPPHAVVTRTANWPKDPDGTALRRAKADSRRPAPSSDSKLDPSQVDALADTPDTPEKPSDRTESCSNVRGTPVCISMPSFNGIPGVENLFGANKSTTEVHLSAHPHRKYLSDPPVTYLAPVEVSQDGGDGGQGTGTVGAAAPGGEQAPSQCMFPGWFGCPERQPVVRISQGGDASAPAQGAPAQGAPAQGAPASQPAAKKCMLPGWFGCPEQ